jgi:hypothetical protein
MRILISFLLLLAIGSSAAAADELTSPHAIVIGFMGGNVPADDATRNELVVSNHLHAAYPNGVYSAVFANRDMEKAHQKILHLLGATSTHQLSGAEKHNAQIILYGHSWGASTVVALADSLQKDGIPVLLTIQVDSIEKNDQDDALIPDNVARAINFYQPDGLLHGRQQITAVNPQRTQILGNIRYAYKVAPSGCQSYPWYERAFIKTHIAIECDPVLWNRIENLIRESLGPPSETAASHSETSSAVHQDHAQN